MSVSLASCWQEVARQRMCWPPRYHRHPLQIARQQKRSDHPAVMPIWRSRLRSTPGQTATMARRFQDRQGMLERRETPVRRELTWD